MTATRRHFKPFDPALLSARQHRTLEELLNALSETARARQVMTTRAMLQALRAAIDARNVTQWDEDLLQFYRALPASRWAATLEEGLRSHDDLLQPDDHATLAALRRLRPDRQKRLVAVAHHRHRAYMPKGQEEKLQARLSRLYGAIMAGYPDILNNTDDYSGAQRLGHLFRAAASYFARDWHRARAQQRLERLQHMLATAYPHDNVGHMHMTAFSSREFAGGFSPSLVTDTMLCGESFLSQDAPDSILFLIAHEYQHRRQMLLADKFEKAVLRPGSAAHIQGRLFSINFAGGYLTPDQTKDHLRAVQTMPAYLDQPAERQANQIAALSNDRAGLTGARQWRDLDREARLAARAAGPVRRLRQISTAIGLK